MSIQMLYVLPLRLLAFLLVAVSVVFAVGGVTVARRRGWQVHPDDNTAAGFIHAFIGVLYAVALGLIVVMVQGEYGDVENAAVREASAASDLYRTMDGIREPARTQLQTEVSGYVDLVVKEEWPAIRRGDDSPRTWYAIDDLARHITRFDPATPREQNLHSDMLEDVHGLLDARRERIHMGQDGIGGVTWTVIVLGAAITLGFACLFQMRSRRAQLVMTSLMATMFALMMFLIIAMDHPLWGDLSVDPGAFVSVQQNIHRVHDGR
jgi:hypothetical protein